eukprot:gnl/TRDRNA2_/TRDRNA2_188067_c0_seq1.p2 gnl/TRDRNA2_/TRDRNA2_188067_c0~~gnl/TRDRNA2_/TRDRNA2_188067_c0_seq1.p2  ORF type:complete len:258 (+),score=93.47 gnl/TRDRNA2_/TRDRNA2_188067_c0_seq1:99-872(+)
MASLMYRDDERDGPSKGKGKGKDEDEMERREAMEMVGGTVTSRRKHKVNKEDQQKKEEEHVSLEWDDIFPKKPMDKLRWLDKAFKAAQAKRIKAAPVFDIIAHRKFVEGLKGAIATDTLNLIRGNLNLFSGKQQKQLTSNNFELFKKYAPIAVLDSDDDEDVPLPPPPKVVIPEQTKRKRNKGGNQKKKDDDSECDSDADLEQKKMKIQSKGVERRVDPADGTAYTLEEFIEQYGGDQNNPPDEWANNRASSFIYKE